MNDYKLLQFKKLKAQQSFLESSLEERQYIFTLEVVPQFHRDFSEFIPEHELKAYKKEKTRPNKLVNDIFKKLSTKLHPDKKGGNKKLFQKANEAKEHNNLSELLDIARELDMDIDDDESMIPILIEKSKLTQNKIDVIEKSLAWQWYHMDDISRKNAKTLFSEVLKKELSVDI
jgi:hypothetical protein